MPWVRKGSSIELGSIAGDNFPRSIPRDYRKWFAEVRKFGKAIWDIYREGQQCRHGIRNHPGEATFPGFNICGQARWHGRHLCKGRRVNLTIDARYLWMHQKRVQGSHFANLRQASRANKLMLDRRLDPCMSEVYPWSQIPDAHMKMRRNEHKPRKHGGSRQCSNNGFEDDRGRT